MGSFHRPAPAHSGTCARGRLLWGRIMSGEKMNGWRIRLGGFAGDTSADNGEWFAGTESLRSDSFHLGVERENIFHSGDGLGFRLHQPLRASGSLEIRIPTGRTRYGDLTWREVSGKTSGRELSLEGLYRRSFDGGSWRVSAGAVSEPGHRAEAKTIGRMLFAFEPGVLGPAAASRCFSAFAWVDRSGRGFNPRPAQG